MKLPLAPIQRIALGVVASAVVVASVSVAAVVTRSASSDSGAPEQQVTLVQPASGEPTTTTTENSTLVTMANDVLGASERAEQAAARAESAAGRAEGSAVRAETAVAAITTTTTSVSAAPATPTDEAPNPGPGVTDPPPVDTTTTPTIAEPTTTTTTVPAKQWVVVARFHPSIDYYNKVMAPVQYPVELETGVLRVSGVDALPSFGMPGPAAVWFGTNSGPALCGGADETVIALSKSGADCPVWEGPYPTGPQTISVGQRWTNPKDNSIVWRAPYRVSDDIVVEEYR